MAGHFGRLDLFTINGALTMTIVPYSPAMRILNTDQLARGTGAKYLEVSTLAPEGALIAVQWRYAKPAKLSANRALVQFKR